MIYTGIDNGLDGGIVHIDENSRIVGQHVMPVRKVGKSREVDPAALNELLKDSDRVMIEAPSKHSPGVLALCSTWQSYGMCVATIQLAMIRWGTVAPQKWQRTFWVRPKMAKGQKFDTKAAALNAANKLWPGHDWTKSERSVKAHDGLVDAALIAEYARKII